MDALTPKRKQEYKRRLDEILNRYTEVEELETANIFHVYPQKEYGFINEKGYHDAQLFQVVAFNDETFQMKKYNRRNNDAIRFYNDVQVKLTQIFIDGAFLIRMEKPEIFHNGCQTFSIGQI